MPFLDDQAGLVLSDIQRLNSVGFITMYAGTSAPGGWLFCDGSAISRVTYSDLFNIIGTSFGVGDGSTTFNIPDTRSRSIMGVGQGVGLTLRALAQILGEENHALTASENGTHTHVQDAHTHLQDAHNHGVTDAGHNHTQDPHTHIQDTHNHTQNSHNHTQNSHNHTQNSHFHTLQGQPSLGYAGGGSFVTFQGGGAAYNGNAATATNIAQTATNIAATATNNTTVATNQNATATNISNVAGISVNNQTATNQNATAVNQNSGLGDGHNTIHPVLVLNFIIKF